MYRCKSCGQYHTASMPKTTYSNISKKLFEKLFVDRLHLITKFKSNIKGAIMQVLNRHYSGKILLKPLMINLT